MNWPSRDRWNLLWQAAGAMPAPAAFYERLMTAYAEPQRHYHTQQHLCECLAEFDQARHLARQPAAAEFALWFHDAVYDPARGDNEEQTASLWKQCAIAAGIEGALVETVASLVMATKTHEVHESSDAGLVVDVDLSILGQAEQRFSEYERQIRHEYAWVPEGIFSSKRMEILQRFVARERIFATEWFRDKYERQARLNLERSIMELRLRAGAS